MESGAGVVLRNDAETIDIVFVLLVLQAAFGLLSALGLLAFAISSGGGTSGWILIVAFGVPLALFVLAAGVTGYRRWARIATAVFEALVVAGAIFRLLVSRGASLNIVMLLTTIAIPLGISGLLFSRSARIAAARRRRHVATKTARAKRSHATAL